MRRWVALALLLTIGTTFSGCATTGSTSQSKLILNEEYFQVAHGEIQNAKESIYLIAYLFLLYDYQDAYPNRILKDLIDAQKRGVSVHVVLDYPKPEYTDDQGPKNQEAYEKLKDAGIDVRFDSPEKRTHNKVLVIDKETIIVGSHNYSFDALRYNNETSLLLRDRDKARALIEYFGQIE